MLVKTSKRVGASRRGRPSRFNSRSRDVLGSAAAVFARAGFAAATMDELASRLGVTRPALYHYAPGKQALFKQCAEAAEAMLDRAIIEALKETDGKARVGAFFLAYCDIGDRDFGRCFALTDLRELDDEMRDSLRRARMRLVRAVARMVEGGIEDASIRACDPALTSALLFSAFNAVALQLEPNEERAALVETILGVFFAGLEPRPNDVIETMRPTPA